MRIRIALADITPPPGVAPTVTGWAPDRPLPLDWQAERFRAKALLMERAGDPPLLLLTVDLLWVSDEMRTRVAAAAEAHGIPSERVMIAPSHTHSGPQTLRTKNPMPGAADESWLLSMEAALAGLVPAALVAEPHDVTPAVASGRYTPLVHRLRPVWMPTRRGPRRRLLLLPNPGGPRDEQVRVLAFRQADGRPVAVIYGYSCHPTVLNGPGLSRDYPGAASDRIRDLTGAEPYFLLGFAGDLRPDLREAWADVARSPKSLARLARDGARRFRYGSHAEMRAFGAGLGDEVARVLPEASGIGGPLDARRIGVSVPMDLGGTAPLLLQRLSIGDDLSLIGVGSEVFQEFAGQARDLARQAHVWPVGLANGVISYLYPERIAPLQPYGVGMSLRPELGVPATFTEEVLRAGLKVVAGAGGSDRLPGLAIRPVTDPDYPECRAAYAEYSPDYRDPAAWRRRMLGADGDRLIAVGAWADDGRWAGGFVTYAMPMRGPFGERLPGGKMEAMIVAKHARGGVFRFDDGRVEKLSVALSRRLIDVSLGAGLDLIFGVPNVPAYLAHRLAGHVLVHLDGYRLERALAPGFWARRTGKQGIALRVIGELQLATPWPNAHAPLQATEVDAFGDDLDALDDARARRMPGIDLARTSAFFRWRYPGDDYLRLECRDAAGALRGTLLAQRRPRDGTAVIIDVAADPDDAGVWTALVGGALDRLAAAGAHTATFHSIGNAPLARRQREALRAAGFFQFPPTPLNWIVDGGPGLRREDLADPSRWSFSGLFSDSF